MFHLILEKCSRITRISHSQLAPNYRSAIQESALIISLQIFGLILEECNRTTKISHNSELAPNYRSAMQESALVISLQMFGLILERTVQLLRDQQNNSYSYPLIVGDDVQILLPAIKVWCDWLLCHSSVWNPPPSCNDYSVGPAGDVWGRLASLVNLLERLDCPQHLLSEKCLEEATAAHSVTLCCGSCAPPPPHSPPQCARLMTGYTAHWAPPHLANEWQYYCSVIGSSCVKLAAVRPLETCNCWGRHVGTTATQRFIGYCLSNGFPAILGTFLLMSPSVDQSLVCQIQYPCQSYDQVKLPEDAVLAGFVPLILHSPDPMYTSVENNMEVACICLRIRKILFCGTVFLCGVDPPVLKLHKNETGTSEYISVVETPSPPAQSDGELCMETVSGNVSEDSGQASEDEGEVTSGGGGGELESLQQRKQQLERSHRRQEKRRQKFQSILQNSLVSVEMEVRPHYLVADTNCFIDYLPQLQTIARASSPSRPHLYTIMVPLVVLNELDGLAHGRRDSTARPQHLAMVTECAASALEFLRSRSSPAIRCVTTKGTILNSTTFTSEEDCQDMKNDDKILATCLKLCHTSSKEEQAVEGQPRKLTRDVVLLTEDRNLRVKAMARDVPVREVLDFMQWAGLLGPEVG
ncbi:Smg-6, nonsense mediated mRNA decay factor [Homalodisca vitripennis]|nr:Smg-6, nonsense mediated mRNA decay factor [Homalodisca vitripennis]